MKNSKNKKINSLIEALNKVLKKEGFKNRGNNWWFHTDETILVVNIQNFLDGDQYYINLGVWIKALADEEYIKNTFVSNQNFPKENECHIRLRLGRAAISDDDRERATKLLIEICNLENEKCSFSERKKVVKDMMMELGLPLLRECSTLRGAIKAFEMGWFKIGSTYRKFDELASRMIKASRKRKDKA